MRLFLLSAGNLTPNRGLPADEPAARRFPYGIAIASGTLLSLVWS